MGPGLHGNRQMGPGIRRPTGRAGHQTADGMGMDPGTRRVTVRELLATGARTARELAEIQGEQREKNRPRGLKKRQQLEPQVGREPGQQSEESPAAAEKQQMAL